MIPRLLAHLTGTWKEQLAVQGMRLTPPLEALQASAPPGAARKITFLVFGAGATRPELVLKIMRTCAHQQQLQREYQILRGLGERAILQQSVPQPLGLFRDGERLVLVERFLPGTPLSHLLQRQPPSQAEVSLHMKCAGAWLRQFQAEEPLRATPFPGWEQVSGRLARLPREVQLPPAFRNRLKELAGRYRGLPLAQVPAHGDFWPGNILWRPDSLSVADWETYHPARSHFYDHYLFLTTYAEAYPWGRWRRPGRSERFRRGFLADTWLARLLAGAMRAHLRQWGLPPASAELWYPLFLLKMATPGPKDGEKRRQQAGPWQERLHQVAATGRLPALTGGR